MLEKAKKIPVIRDIVTYFNPRSMKRLFIGLLLLCVFGSLITGIYKPGWINWRFFWLYPIGLVIYLLSPVIIHQRNNWTANFVYLILISFLLIPLIGGGLIIGIIIGAIIAGITLLFFRAIEN